MPYQNTEKELKMIIDGFNYHGMALSKFLGEHVSDPYFQTAFGKKMMQMGLKLCTTHVLMMTEYLMKDQGKKGEEDTTGIEDLLKSMINEEP